jgi:hypothetical protein
MPRRVRASSDDQLYEDRNAGNGVSPMNWVLSDKIAAIAIIIGALQFLALVATVAVTVRTSRRQLRAYIFNDHANLVDFDGIPVAQILLKNAGQTPARDVVAWNVVLLGAFPLEVELTRPSQADVSRCNLGPGMTFHITTQLSRLSDSTKAAIREGRQALYVYGRADYADIFGKRRFLEWRLLFGADSARRPDGNLLVSPLGNSAN